MHDIRAVRDNPEAFIRGLKRRGLDGDAIAADVLARDKALRELLTRLQIQQARRNDASKLIGQAKQKKDEAGAKALMDEVAGLKDAIQQGEAEQRGLEAEVREALAVIPNVPAADVPDGADESANVPVPARAFGNPPTIANPKQHFEIGEALGQMDFERAAKVSGARFVYLKGDLARLERALGAFMLDIHTRQFGYTEMSPPVLVRDKTMFGTGQLPKFYDDQFAAFQEPDLRSNFLRDVRTTQIRVLDEAERAGILAAREMELKPENIRLRDDPSRFWLIPTAEVSLTNYVNDEIVAEAELPMRLTAFTPCFRAEAGAAGKDTRGMIRMHQFSKVELVSITTPEQSLAEHERMTDAAQEILKKLESGPSRGHALHRRHGLFRPENL